MRLRRVSDCQSQLYQAAMAVLRDSIAGEAQLPEQRLSDLLAGGNYRLFASVRSEDVQGAALVYLSDKLRFGWLDYFAIRSDLRGRGLGSELFSELVELLRQQDPVPDWLLFEVDDDFRGDARRQAEGLRRIEFYRRLGACLLENVPYKFPSAFVEPIRMRLMAFQIHPGATLDPQGLKHMVRDLFVSVHGRASEDKLLGWFEQGLPRTLEMK